MENTGRITGTLTEPARRILFGPTADGGIEAELDHICRVDRAHLVMLAERGIISRAKAAKLLREIDRLRARDFEPLRGRPARRGLYLLYEDYLIEKLGAETGGALQTARSRNDLNATVLRLRLRAPYSKLLIEAQRLVVVSLRRARRFAGVVMPIYTHYQPATPGTYGHYLAGVAIGLERDLCGLVDAASDLDRCPLGAGSAGGTSLPIDPARTAALLGFGHPSRHSIDSVASRDLILRLLAAAAILGVTMSRMATDLLLWATTEFGFLAFPDHLVGSSSMMPQKRNPFLLEHAQGRSAAALGGFTAAAAAMHSKPFTNSIAVGTEATGQVWHSLQKVTEACVLLRLAVAGAAPQSEPMRRAAVDGYTSATELANRLVVEGGLSFRSAHHAVGSLVRSAVESGETLDSAVAGWQADFVPRVSLAKLDPASVVRNSTYGGGPGPSSLDSCLRFLSAQLSRHLSRRRDQLTKWKAAEEELQRAVAQLSDGFNPSTQRS